MRIGDRIVTGWSDLTDAEHYLLSEALEPGPYSLFDVLSGWLAGSPDGAYWNRKGAYVDQLMPAAIGLICAGLLAIQVAGPEGRVTMSRQDAEQAVSDVGNWWEYEPTEEPDPDVDSARYTRQQSIRREPGAHPDAGWHSIAETDLIERLRRDEPATLRRGLARSVSPPTG